MKRIISIIIGLLLLPAIYSCGESKAEKEARIERERHIQDSILQVKKAIEEERIRQEKEQREREELARKEREKRAFIVGRWGNAKIDPIHYTCYYHTFKFNSDGTYKYSRSTKDFNYIFNGPTFKYTVRDNMIYNEEGEPLLRIDYSNGKLTRPNNSGDIFEKLN